MLSENEIRNALHASRVVLLDVPNSHGPLGLEHIAEAVAHQVGSVAGLSGQQGIKRPLMLPEATWEKLDRLARDATKTASQPVSASEVAAVLLEQLVTAK